MSISNRDEGQVFKVVLAERKHIVREALKRYLAPCKLIELVGDTGDGFELNNLIEKYHPNLVITGPDAPGKDPLEILKDVKKKDKGIKFLILSSTKREDIIIKAFEYGADGFVLKEDKPDELDSAIRNILEGKHYISPSIAGLVLKARTDAYREERPATKWDTLTRREREIFKLLAEGRKAKEIASTLYISPKTVEKHRSNLMKKLGLHSVSQLVNYAIEIGIMHSNHK